MLHISCVLKSLNYLHCYCQLYWYQSYDLLRQYMDICKLDTETIQGHTYSVYNDHHQILKNNLKITVPKIDNMILQSIKAGALGAKVIGSGGGGSILVIPEKSKEKNVIESLFNSGSVQVDKVKILKN